MPSVILMPALSPTMEFGNLVKWLKNEGDEIVVGDVIAEIDTDKTTIEVEAMQKGTLHKILVAEGTMKVMVKSPIAVLKQKGDTDESVENLIAKLSSSEEQQTDTHPAEKKDKDTEKNSRQEADEFAINKKKSSPLAKKLAMEKGVSLENISGTGPYGRVVKADVLKALEHSNARTDNTISAPVRTSSEYIEEKASNMRIAIANKLTEAKQTVPHFCLMVESNLDKALLIREVFNKNFKDNKITVNDIIIKAVGNALASVPELNVSWHDGMIRKYTNSDVAVSVAVDGGIFTPVIKNADQKSLVDISKEIKEMARRAKSGTLLPSEYHGGGITISNLGMFGVNNFTSIINTPQGSIISVGAGVKKPIVTDSGEIKVATMVDLTIACDHRVIDGSVAARFMNFVRETIEGGSFL